MVRGKISDAKSAIGRFNQVSDDGRELHHGEWQRV